MEELKSLGLGLLIFGACLLATMTFPMILLRAGIVAIFVGAAFFVGNEVRQIIRLTKNRKREIHDRSTSK